jgi:hypothetical protein
MESGKFQQALCSKMLPFGHELIKLLFCVSPSRIVWFGVPPRIDIWVRIRSMCFYTRLCSHLIGQIGYGMPLFRRHHHLYSDKNKMSTDKNLMKLGCIIVSVCDLCMSYLESKSHLFLYYQFATQLWQWLGSLLCIVFDTSCFQSLFESFAAN